MHTKISKSDFFFYPRCFYAHKNAVFFICLCAFCAFLLKYFYARLRLFLFYLLMCFLCQTSNFFPLRRFYAHLRMFLFLFAYVLFMVFMLVTFFFERYKTSSIPSFTILLLPLWLLRQISFCGLCFMYLVRLDVANQTFQSEISHSWKVICNRW